LFISSAKGKIMAVKTEAIDALGSALSTGLNTANTAAGGYDNAGNLNTTGIALGLAQTIQSAIDAATKGLQSSNATWGKAVPGIGGVLGVANLGLGVEWSQPLSTADQVNVAGSGAAIAGGVTYALGWTTATSVAGFVGVVAGGVQIVSLASEQRAAAAAQQAVNPNVQPIGNPSLINPRTLLPVRPDLAPDQSTLSAAVEVSENSNRAQAQALSAAAKIAAAAEQAAQAFRASEIAYTNSQSSSSSYNNGLGGGYDGAGGSSGYDGGHTYGYPIVIDLNGDGVQLNPLGSSHASFDFDNDGYREATAWAGPQDGILVIDEGGDGVVTQAREIAFSQWTAEDDTDLQALAKTFDSNHDGVLDAKDARFSDFKVWKDANGDGVSDAGEMQTLTQAGIQSMNLTVKSGTSASLSDGTQVFGLTDVQRTDGSIVQAADVAFAYNTLGYRTKIDANGNTVYEFESGSALHYRNMEAGATGTQANFNLGTDTDATLWIGATGNAAANVLDGGAGHSKANVIAIKSIAACAINTGARGLFGLHVAANIAAFKVAA
jgi:hypothetical protein